MNKRLLLILSVVFIVLALVAALSFNKSRTASRLKQGGLTSANAIVAQAKDLETKGSLLDSRAAYQKLISEYSSSGEVMVWQKKIEDLNLKLLFSPVLTSKSALYEIKPGDTLIKISKEFKTTVELLKKSNNLQDDRIVPNRKIKVSTATFNIFVDKSQNILILKRDEEIFKTYIVSTGANNSTPVGTFKIVNKLPNPTWFKAGAVVAANSPENALGTRWMGFDLAGYGIHGTIEPLSLGKQVTQGCVRLANSEAEELYSIVPAGTAVTIVD